MTQTESTQTGPGAKERLLAAGRRLFAREGVAGASVRDLAAEAGVNLAAVAYHFGSKEALYHEVLRSILTPVFERMSVVGDAGLEPLDRIEQAIRAHMAYVHANPELPALMIREMASGAEPAPPLTETFGELLPMFVRTITEGQRRGEIRAGDPLLLTLSCIAQPVYLALARPVITRVLAMDPSAPDNRARIVTHVVTTVRALLANHDR